MNNRFALRLLLTLLILPACGDDDPVNPGPDPQQTFQPLTSRSAVVNNLEVAWNERRTDKIDELLDPGFTFYFAPGDVGGEIPESWDRNTEMATTDALFTSNIVPSPTVPVCTLVRVDLVYDELTWDEMPVPASARGEVWYTTTVNYSATFEVEPDITFIMVPGSAAQLVVRAVEDGYRLVQWRDLGGTLVAMNGSSQAKTWGSIKSLYR